MAEAVVENRPQNRFFCHQCKAEITPNLPDYTCPRCESGFIEEIEDDLEQPRNAPSDSAAQFAELFSRSFLQSFTNHLDPNHPMDSDIDEDLDTPPPMGQFWPQTRLQTRGGVLPGLFTMPGARISIRTRQANPVEQVDGGGAAVRVGLDDQRNQALHSILQNVLSGIMGGAMQGQGAQFPVGGMVNMYGNPGDYAWGTGGLDNIITQLLNQLEGAGPPPAKPEDISGLQHLTITKTETESGQQCSVCMEDFVVGETVKGLPCEHLYHTDCIIPWLELHGTCPVCRKPVNTSNCDPNSTQLPAATHTNGLEGSRSSDQTSSSRSQNHEVSDSLDLYEDEFD